MIALHRLWAYTLPNESIVSINFDLQGIIY